MDIAVRHHLGALVDHRQHHQVATAGVGLLPPNVLGRPAQIRLAGADADKLIIEPLQA
jgi:hypothetical protein